MNTIIRYIISGGAAAIVDLSILNYLDSTGVHYLISVNTAFLIAFVVSFTLQKYWTFNDTKNAKTHRELIMFFIVSATNVFINGLLVHLIVYYDLVSDILFLRQVVVAQIISSTLIAIESFILYRFFIFRKKSLSTSKLLIVTQKVDIDDSYFAFFHDWVVRFAKECDEVTIITLEVGRVNLPSNVRILSLKKGSKITSLWRLWKYSLKNRNSYSKVFCHMSPIFVIAGWPIWKMFNKKIVLWYVHRSVDTKLRIAHALVDRVFTATPESFNIKSNKVCYMGQAVDIARFKRPNTFQKSDTTTLKLMTVGRITSIKNLSDMVLIVDMLKQKGIMVKLSIVGAAVMDSDIQYEVTIENLIRDKKLDNEIVFLGPIANRDIPKYYWENDICLNLAPTGGLDKTVLEAMAAHMPVILYNKAFSEHLGVYSKDLLCTDARDCADKIIRLYKNDKTQMIKTLTENVIKKSSLDNLITSIVTYLNE